MKPKANNYYKIRREEDCLIAQCLSDPPEELQGLICYKFKNIGSDEEIYYPESDIEECQISIEYLLLHDKTARELFYKAMKWRGYLKKGVERMQNCREIQIPGGIGNLSFCEAIYDFIKYCESVGWECEEYC